MSSYDPQRNPYAPPQVFGEQATIPPSADGLWRQGKYLVMHRSATLPALCVKSGEPAMGRLPRKLQWHHPAIYALLLCNLIIYAIVAMILQKKATIDIGLSEYWLGVRRRAIWIGWLSALGGIGAIVAGISLERFAAGPWIALTGLVSLLFGIFYGVFRARLVYAHKIDDQYIWLAGVHSSYLDQLPPWPYA